MATTASLGPSAHTARMSDTPVEPSDCQAPRARTQTRFPMANAGTPLVAITP